MSTVNSQQNTCFIMAFIKSWKTYHLIIKLQGGAELFW
jgi:hypothetical protein